MAVKRREYDEDDVRIRPGRPSRPRSRIRPRHVDAEAGFVVGVDRGRYTCVLTGPGRTVTAMRARELGRRSVVVGDRVALVGDVSGEAGSLARIVRIRPRTSVLRRTADDDRGRDPWAGSSSGGARSRPTERVIVANAEQLVIVCSVQDPPPRTGFIDRCLVAAYDADVVPLLCLTKTDLPAAARTRAELADYYADLELATVSCRPDEPLTALRARLTGRLSVLVGHSGVGKSTLVNRLVPGADRTVGELSAIGRGRHVSTSAVALPLSDTEDPSTTPAPSLTSDPSEGPDLSTTPGWLVDTPGVRSFGLAHVSAETLLHGFPDLAEGTADCPPGCDHATGAVGCGLDALVAAGGATAQRLASYRRLLASRAGEG